MGSVTYIATESLLPHREAGDTVTMDIGFQDARRSRATEKNVQVSMGGAMEVLKHRSQSSWSLTFEPVAGAQLEQLREFLDSTEGGESFTVDPYGTSSAPKRVKRTDSGYSEEPFIRMGYEDRDYFVVRIEVVEL